MSQVVTRFAPSPTGFLHIGGARTALFNWLYAKKHGGRMMLRIEDTDRERSTQAAIGAIIDGLQWLGLEWDGDIVYQSSRAARHAEVAEELLAQGHAYRCYATAQELEEMREKAKAEKRPWRYDGRWRDRDPSEAPAGAPYVVRIKAPQDGETIVDDAVQGRVVFQNKDLDDFILLRSDGAPTYMLAVVVDDHDMGVTQIIRGDDHLTNAARQTHIYQAMGWTIPAFAHIPLIHGPDGAKLSKRHGALGVDAYRAMGYLPAALRNYLVRLGWSQGDKEFFTTPEMVESFDLSQVHRSPARFDFAKLENMNGHYLRDSDDDELLDLLRRHASLSRRRRRDRTGARRQNARAVARRLAGTEGAREDLERTSRRRGLSLRAATAVARRKGGAAAFGGSARAACEACRETCSASELDGRKLQKRSCAILRQRLASNWAISHSLCAPRSPAVRRRPAFSTCWKFWGARKALGEFPIRLPSGNPSRRCGLGARKNR